MTTIVWDGTELVGDGLVTHALVDTGTRSAASVWNYRGTMKRDEVKLLVDAPFLFQGQPVQALGYSGNYGMLLVLRGIADKATRLGERLELTSQAMVDTFTTSAALSSLILVTADAAVNYISLGDKHEVTWTCHQRSTPLMVGTGVAAAGKVFFLPGATARDYVGFCAWGDVYTGGRMSVWDGKALQTNLRVSAPSGVRRIMSCALKNDIKCAARKLRA